MNSDKLPGPERQLGKRGQQEGRILALPCQAALPSPSWHLGQDKVAGRGMPSIKQPEAGDFAQNADYGWLLAGDGRINALLKQRRVNREINPWHSLARGPCTWAAGSFPSSSPGLGKRRGLAAAQGAGRWPSWHGAARPRGMPARGRRDGWRARPRARCKLGPGSGMPVGTPCIPIPPPALPEGAQALAAANLGHPNPSKRPGTRTPQRFGAGHRPAVMLRTPQHWLGVGPPSATLWGCHWWCHAVLALPNKAEQPSRPQLLPDAFGQRAGSSALPRPARRTPGCRRRNPHPEGPQGANCTLVLLTYPGTCPYPPSSLGTGVGDTDTPCLPKCSAPSAVLSPTQARRHVHPRAGRAAARTGAAGSEPALHGAVLPPPQPSFSPANKGPCRSRHPRPHSSVCPSPHPRSSAPPWEPCGGTGTKPQGPGTGKAGMGGVGQGRQGGRQGTLSLSPGPPPACRDPSPSPHRQGTPCPFFCLRAKPRQMVSGCQMSPWLAHDGCLTWRGGCQAPRDLPASPCWQSPSPTAGVRAPHTSACTTLCAPISCAQGRTTGPECRARSPEPPPAAPSSGQENKTLAHRESLAATVASAPGLPGQHGRSPGSEGPQRTPFAALCQGEPRARGQLGSARALATLQRLPQARKSRRVKAGGLRLQLPASFPSLPGLGEKEGNKRSNSPLARRRTGQALFLQAPCTSVRVAAALGTLWAPRGSGGGEGTSGAAGKGELSPGASVCRRRTANLLCTAPAKFKVMPRRLAQQ